jgi:hypothetical protein
MYTRSARPKKSSTNPSTPAKPSKARPAPKPLRNKRIDQLRDQYHELFDKAEAFKDDVLKAESKEIVAKNTAALASGIVRDSRL